MDRKHSVDHAAVASQVRALHEGGDAHAREELVVLLYPLVVMLARRFAHRGERLEDLVQVGSVGLLEAIDRFDPARGGDLVAFAVPTITGEIKRHLRDRCSIVRVPRRVAELRSCVRPARTELTQALGRAPTLDELAEATGAPAGEVAAALSPTAGGVVVGLPALDGLLDALVVDGGYDDHEERIALAVAFRTLAPRERRILHLRFFAGLTQSEIAGVVGLSQIHVSRLIRTSLERLRAALEERSRPTGTGRTAA